MRLKVSAGREGSARIKLISDHHHTNFVGVVWVENPSTGRNSRTLVQKWELSNILDGRKSALNVTVRTLNETGA
jgi:hypothetical protein